MSVIVPSGEEETMPEEQKCEDCGAPMREEIIGKPETNALSIQTDEEREFFATKVLRKLVCTREPRHTPVPL
jgi:hypothetical protein